MEEGLLRNDLRQAYAAVRRMKGSSTSHITPVRKKDGSSCNSHEELLSRWTEYYSEALNHPTAVPCPELDAQQFQAVDDPEVPVDAPTLDEVRASIKKLKFGRAAGRDAIPQMLKLAIDPTSRILRQLFASVWATGKVPCAWKEGIIIKALYFPRPTEFHATPRKFNKLRGIPRKSIYFQAV